MELSNIIIFVVLVIIIITIILWMFRYQLMRVFWTEESYAESWFGSFFSSLTPLANLSYYTT